MAPLVSRGMRSTPGRGWPPTQEDWREVEAVCAAIPHHDLCIQWDVCHEMLIWDGQPLDMYGNKLPSKYDPAAHIPLDDFTFLPELFR